MRLAHRVHRAARSSRRGGQGLTAPALLLLGAGLLGGGCADVAGDSLAQDVAQLQQDVSQLKLNVQRARVDPEALARLERTSREQNNDNARQIASLSSRIENLNGELQRISSELSRLSSQVQRLSAQRTETRAPEAAPRRTEPAAPAAPPPPAAPAPSGGTVIATPPPKEGATQDERYQAAYQDYSKGHYALAIPALRDYVRQYPDSPLADSAQCAIGESYVGLARASAASGQADKSRQETEQAVQEFRKVLVNYPRGSKAPTALYKEALALIDLKQTALAQARLRYLLDHFPQSEEAPLAKDRLSNLTP
jgi:TolA-binding protein